MKFKVNGLKCAGCGACLRACPHGAIEMREDGKAFIDQNKCKKCGTCQGICPFDAIETIESDNGETRGKISIDRDINGDRGTGIGRSIGRSIGGGMSRGPQDGRGGGRGGRGRQY